MNDFKQQAQHITPKTNKKRPYGDYGDGKRLKMKFEELHNDKETNDEYLLNTVKEFLNKGELCLFMSETGLFMIKARQYYRNSIKVDDITYAQMKAIFDILGIDTEEVLK